ncbi:MAG: glycoside hydrolase family 47 protein [Flavisolibacter sp.]
MCRLLLIPVIFFSILANGQSPKDFPAALKKEMKDQVIAACKHAWSGYKQYAWGFDDLQPLTKNGKNWYQHSMLMTPVDSYDSFIMLGMKEEAQEAKKIILSQLNFDVDNEVQVFEITIRLLGGLISAYELDGDNRFLLLAIQLADRMMPAFNTPTGMPWRYIHLQTGKVRDSINNPAEIGTLMLEFGKLSQITGNKKYYEAAKKAIMAVYEKRSSLGLAGIQINILSGQWVNTESQIGAYVDSYYEYLFKAWKLFNDEDFKKAWDVHDAAIKKHLIVKQEQGWFLTHVDMNTGKEKRPYYGALDAFYAGLIAYAGDVATAKEVQKANAYMWKRFRIEPETFNFRTDTVVHGQYVLRPENIESCFYLYRATRDIQYLWMGKEMFDDIITYCKHETGFASIRNVITMEKMNSMQSFFLAETLKYAFLLFADDSKLNLDEWVLNTEAHPFKKINYTKN